MLERTVAYGVCLERTTAADPERGAGVGAPGGRGPVPAHSAQLLS